ncbi:uncharacterized protein LOC144165211 [Haemaphysalis longicornis]
MGTGSWSPNRPDVASDRAVVASPRRESHASPVEKGRPKPSTPSPDGILSWAVAVICFVINFLSSVFNRCAGLFFNSMMSTFEASRGQVAVPVSLYGGFYNLAGLLAGALIQAFGVRRTMVLGGVMMTMGFCISVFADSPTFLVFAVGLATGAGQGIVMSCSIVAVTTYFDKWRGIALGLNLAGPPVTSLVVPKLVQWMLDEYGLRGTFLLVGACFANVAALGTLLHKPPWEKRKPETSPEAQSKVGQSFQRHSVACDSQDNPGDTICSQTENGKPMVFSRTPAVVNRLPSLVIEGPGAAEKTASSRRETMQSCHRSLSRSRENSIASKNGQAEESDAPPLCMASQRRRVSMERRGTVMSVAGSMFAVKLHTLSEVNAGSRRSTLISARSSCNLPPVPSNLPVTSFVETPENPPVFSISNVKDVLKHPRIYLHSLSFLTYAFFVDTYLSVILDFAKDIGLPPSESVHALALFSALDTVGRFGLPFLSDYKVMSTELLLTLSYLVLAVIAEVAPFLSGKFAFMSLAALLGIPGGYIYVGTSELLSKDHGAKNLPMAYGFMTLVTAIGYFVRPPIIGVFRDTFGSYNGLFKLQGGLLLLSFAINVGLWARFRSSQNKSNDDHHAQDSVHDCYNETVQPVNK